MGETLRSPSSGAGREGGNTQFYHFEMLITAPTSEKRGDIMAELQAKTMQSLEEHGCWITGQGASYRGSGSDRRITAFDFRYECLGNHGFFSADTFRGEDGQWHLSVIAGEW